MHTKNKLELMNMEKIDNEFFDKNQCNLLKGFLDLKDKCFSEEKKCFGEEVYQENLNNNFVLKSFYSSLRDVINLPIYFIVNEELSNIQNREGFHNLWDQVFRIDNINYRFRTNEQHFNDFCYLFNQQYNSILGSMMLDFTVSAFSTFEHWINILFEAICEEERENIIYSRKNKIKKIIRNILENEDDLDKYPDRKFDSKIEKIIKNQGYHFSIMDKFNCIQKNIEKNKQNYCRDIKRDREIIEFLAAKRNTIHNLGVNNSSSRSINFLGKEKKLSQGTPYFSESYVDDLKLFEELIYIYTELFRNIGSENICKYCDHLLSKKGWW